MLSSVEVVLHAIVIFLIPQAVFSLFTRALPADTTLLGRIYRADPRLLVVNNLFLLSLGVVAIGRLGLHFGLIDPKLGPRVELFTEIPFMILLVVSLGFLVRACLKLRRDAKSNI